MSISDKLEARLVALDGDRLVRLPALVPSPLPNRTVWVTEEVYDAVQPVRDGTWDDYRLSLFRGSLDAFTNCEEVSVAQDPFNKASDAFLARVHPVGEEIWDIRTTEPPQGIRCPGCFADFDVFIALIWDYRENLTDSHDWDEAVAKCKAAWRDLFGSLAPYSGDSLDAYLSNFIPV